MNNKVSINNNSVDSAGITKDYMEAICELVWNGFDANATAISIEFNANEVGFIDSLHIKDNGTGIDFSTLNKTFGAFLDSIKKKTFQRSSYVRGKKGKGRFSFIALAYNATWHTTYKDEEKNKFITYDILIDASNKDTYKDEPISSSDNGSTGTHLTLNNLIDLTGFSFEYPEFIQFLTLEFGWFLLLNSKNNYSLTINGKPITYEGIVADIEEVPVAIKDKNENEHTFAITYVRWTHKIGDKYYYYFLDSDKKENFKQLTSFNNNSINFYHSVFIESDFFNEFTFTSGNEDQSSMFETNQHSPVFKTLVKELNKIIDEKQKAFIRESGANELIDRLERNGAIPYFRNNKYEQEKKKDLVDVVKEIYCIHPRIFKGLNETQERTSIGFINLLLDTDERENILTILDGIVSISAEERLNLATLLKKTSFGRITRTINLIENRFRTVELLKTLVFDLKLFTNERDHVQHAIAENYWLFGEQFHLVSANEGFEKLLVNYLNILDGEDAKPSEKSNDPEKNRRPDIFMCRQRFIPDGNSIDDDIEENIMVELKRPTVTIGKDQLRQIEDYLDFISRQDQFNSKTRNWKFFVVSNKIDAHIESQYTAFKDKGKRHLVKAYDNKEIFAMSWDDVFRTFATKHKYLLDKLEFDHKAIKEELKLKGITFDAKGADELTKIIKLNANDDT